MRWVEGADERRRARKAMQWWTERSLVSCWLRWREFHIEYTEAAYILTARAWGEWAEAAETTRNKRGTMLRAMAKMNSRKVAAALANDDVLRCFETSTKSQCRTTRLSLPR